MVSLSRYSEKRNQKLPAIELGCGVTPMKDNFGDVIASDIEPSPYADKIIDSLSMPFRSNSLDTIFAINCFHHFSSKQKFLEEARRVLALKGTIVLLEPSFSILSRLIYPFLFKEETYNIYSSIEELNTYDPMLEANQAASYICFEKYRKDFLHGSGFDIEKIEYCTNSLSYILCGGINFPQLAPLPIINFLTDIKLPPLIFSLHWIIVLRKKN